MLTSGGYPENYEKGKVISGLENLDSDIVVFHSGTKFDNENIVTNGGRVIGIDGVCFTLMACTHGYGMGNIYDDRFIKCP